MINLVISVYPIVRRAWRYQRSKSKKNRQHNGQKKRDKRTNNDLQSIHIELKIE